MRLVLVPGYLRTSEYMILQRRLLVQTGYKFFSEGRLRDEYLTSSGILPGSQTVPKKINRQKSIG